MADKKLNVTCPCCDTRILIDPETGVILWYEAKESDAKGKGPSSLSDMIADLDRQKRAAAEKVEQEKKILKDKGRLLEEKVKEAMKRVDPNDDTPPVRPFDLD
jgi:hypothetical protein